MPKATASVEAERHDLKTLEGGFIRARRLTYGEILKRRELVQTMRGRPSQGNKDEAETEVSLHFLDVQVYEFGRCIIEHNLELEDGGRTLNLSTKEDVLKLDPRVGQEIENILDAMNNPPTDTEEEHKKMDDTSTESDSPKEKSNTGS